MINKMIRGRGAQSNPRNRFERLNIESFSNDEIDCFYSEDSIERKIPTQYFKDDSKTVISVNDSEDIDFDYSFNPYRGCEHGCIYCYARPSHEFLGFSSGLDFETKIMIKDDAPKLLESEFKKKSYKPDIIIFSGNTDCYQPIESKLKLTRKALEVCLKYRNPVGLITKNALVLRDLDIIKELSKKDLISVTITITSLDKSLISKMEPRTSVPAKRLETIQKLAENNIPVGVNIAPVIPGLNDEEIPLILKAASEMGAEYAGFILLRLPYSVKDLFVNWLNSEFPQKANKIINRIKDIRGGKLNNSEFGKRFS
ncbi:MAG: PA0069 family radical SAM protein, partial [Ignavibacteriaceae bacterium]